MSGTWPALAFSVPADACEFPHVLGGMVLDGAAGRLARMLDRGFLDEAGWDPRMRVLRLPAQHQLLGRRVCRADGCERTVRGGLPAVCLRCFTRLSGLGMSTSEIAAASALPAAHPRADHCAVRGCQCVPTVRHAVLCEPHARTFRTREPRRSLEQFLADPRLRPLPALGPCQVAACSRRAESEHGYCPTHYVRWRTTITTDPDTDQRHWQLTQPAVSEGGQISLRGLPPVVVLEVLFGVQQRVRGGAKILDVTPADGLQHPAPRAGAAGRSVPGSARARQTRPSAAGRARLPRPPGADRSRP